MVKRRMMNKDGGVILFKDKKEKHADIACRCEEEERERGKVNGTIA